MHTSRLWMLILLAISGVSFAQVDADIRIHGSNTVGAELAPALVKEWLRHEGYSQITEKYRATEYLLTGANSKGAAVTIELDAQGSSTGFQALANEHANVWMSSRPIKPAEVSALSKYGRCDTAACEYVIGLDGIAVIVNPENPVAKLDKATLRRIFTGDIRDWSEVGGKPGAIQLYAPDKNSGTYDTFKSLVLEKAKLASHAKRDASHEVISREVASNPRAIGFVGLPYVHSSRPLPIADGDAHPIVPGAFSIATEDYVLSRRLFFYVPEGNAAPLVKKFVQFAVSDAGQEVVKQVGFVSQEIIAGSVPLDASAPEEYRKLVADARRLSLNFRFLPGTTKLDNKAERDIHRLKQYMLQPANNGKGVMLFGFADSDESMPIVSLRLSNNRADTVADLLLDERIRPEKVRGYGNAVPVASNKSKTGRAKNRRVEVWVR